ncbi:putative transcription factor MYC/MYB [Helianthus annuus]|nr:putative transcription factor MYC/MYB [Helianthus annuus]KAJ0717602.1 putative transcription factor MYC/MYB [Helianthus annuus]KAJ0899877.1 putative transcription factor MYC/MYB [Helianthus annuus]
MMVLMKMLRPLVENNAWDYCIVWKFGDDPSSGSQGVCRNVKEEMELLHVPYLCRDVYVKHSIRTSACEKLAMIPSSLSLFHGIHGEVAVSKQPMWLSNDSIGTQIVVPVEGGLIELYRSKHVRFGLLVLL